MRRIWWTLALLTVSVSAQAAIGIEQHRLPAGSGHPPVPFVLLYPTRAEAHPMQLGPYRLSAAANAAPARLRGLVVVSHGSGGGPLSLLDQELALARNGWLVAAPLYLGDSAPDHSRSGSRAMFIARARATSAVIDYLRQARQWAHAWPQEHVAILGYSAGGATALALLGISASLRNVVAHCRGLPREGLCLDGAGRRSRSDLKPIPDLRDPRIRRAILFAPVTAPFSDQALAGLSVPSLVVRAQFDHQLDYPYHAARLARLAPSRVRLKVLKHAGHFAFLSLPHAFHLPPAMQERPGFDRGKAHARLDSLILGFLAHWAAMPGNPAHAH